MARSTISLSLRKQPKQGRSQRLVEDVSQAAIQVLLKEGARRFTTARVAQVAGVSVGSLYQYFPNKEPILFRLQVEEWRSTSALLLAILEDGQREPLQRLRLAVTAFLHSECAEAPIRTALADAAPLFRDAPEAQGYRRGSLRRFVAYWRQVLPQASRAERTQAGDLVGMTVKAIGKRVSEQRRTPAEVEAFAQSLGDMLCAYLEQLRAGGGNTQLPSPGQAPGQTPRQDKPGHPRRSKA